MSHPSNRAGAVASWRLPIITAAVLLLGGAGAVAHFLLRVEKPAPEDPGPPARRDDTKDWPMYNRDVLGTRHNRGETAIDKSNAGRLDEKWRFPAKGAELEIGVIHATPVVMDGYVYFGTVTDPTFYKLTPDGKVRWTYRHPDRPQPSERPKDEAQRNARFQSSPNGIFSSALVTGETVFF